MNRGILRGANLAACLFVWLALSAQAASFDCAKASTKVEHMICDNPEISKLDDELATRYKAVLQDKAKAKAVKEEQRLWLRDRNSCREPGCLKMAYQTRAKELAEILNKTGVLPRIAGFYEPNADGNAAAKKYPPYPDVWQWKFPSPQNAVPLNLFMLSNGDVLAGNKLLFGGQSVVSGELLPANVRGDLVKVNGKDLLKLNDGSLVAGVRAGNIFGRIKLANGLGVVSVGSNMAHGDCDHGPVDSFFYVRDERTGKQKSEKVIFLLLDRPKYHIWDRLVSPNDSSNEIDPCTEEGPPGYSTRVEAVWGGGMFPLDDGTFLLPMSNGLIVRFDEHFNTKAPLLNHRFFVFDVNDSKLFIDKLNGKSYDLGKTGYQPVYDDLYQYLTNVRSKQP